MATTITPLPKAEIHRHLEGSVRAATFLDIAERHNLDVPTHDLAELKRLIQMAPDDPKDFQFFLSKFARYRGFYPDGESIRRVAAEAVQDAARDNIRYLELRYSPIHFALRKNFPLADVAVWVTESAREAAKASGMRVEFIATLGRNFGVAAGRPVGELIAKEGPRFFRGVDLAGIEPGHPAVAFREFFEEARRQGLGVTIHAGEACGPENIWEAIDTLGADRIGHGVRAAEDPALVAELARRKIPIECCLTSNLHTGVVKRIEDHPAKKLFNAGIPVTLNTDDPAISGGITLSGEYNLAVEKLGFTRRDIQTTLRNTVEAAFLSDAEKQMVLADTFPAENIFR
ncbi:MAG: adenosine deaminase [Planctomycetota bacterium]